MEASKQLEILLHIITGRVWRESIILAFIEDGDCTFECARDDLMERYDHDNSDMNRQLEVLEILIEFSQECGKEKLLELMRPKFLKALLSKTGAKNITIEW